MIAHGTFIESSGGLRWPMVGFSSSANEKGRLTEDSTVVLESTLFAGLESELRKTFLQWRDGQRIVGVKFSDESVGARFAQRLASVVSAIGSEEGAAATATSSPASSVSSVVSSPVVPAASKEGAAVSVAARKGPTVRKSGVALLTPRAQTSRQLFQRVDSMAMPESNVCCVCGTEKNDLLLKSVNSDGTVEGEVLRLTQTRADALPKRLCTACWIRNLLEQK